MEQVKYIAAKFKAFLIIAYSKEYTHEELAQHSDNLSKLDIFNMEDEIPD